jgi:hypothetical protein
MTPFQVFAGLTMELLNVVNGVSQSRMFNRNSKYQTKFIKE